MQMEDQVVKLNESVYVRDRGCFDSVRKIIW